MFIDTNYILRYVLNDIQEQAQQAADIIANGAEIYPEIIPEAVYVLCRIYGIDRKNVSETLLSVVDDISVERKEQIKEALRLFRDTRLYYVDCLMLAGFISNGNDFTSFDKKLMERKKKSSRTSY